jgi:hypothetical protein
MKVYIHIHGSDDAYYVSDSRADGSIKKYTPDELAALLMHEGLTTQIRDVRLYACASGEAGAIPAFADRLKVAMVSKGYSAVMVTGYLNDVKASYAPRLDDVNPNVQVPDIHKGAYDPVVGGEVRASKRRVRF